MACLCVLVGLSTACASRSAEKPVPASSTGNPGDDGVGPYVSVAVDNHFHDIHPGNHIQIAPDRAFVIKNEGSNLHNVTIVETDISEDIQPGEKFELDPVGAELDPGTYHIVCRFHGDRGMTGEITVLP